MNKLVIFNLLGFNLVWFGLVYWGNIFIPMSLLLLMAHVLFVAKGSGELWLILAITLVGIFVDSILMHFKVFIFSNSTHIPFWLIVLWACFAATICHSLSFLEKSKVWQFLVGAILAPLSYIAGYNFHAVDFGQSISLTYLLLSFTWAILFILFFALKDRLVST